MLYTFRDGVPDEYAMDAEQEWALVRFRLADRFKWTYEYIDTLTDWQVRQSFALIAAENKYNEEQARKRGKHR